MQFFHSKAKYLAVMSCSLLIGWYTGNMEAVQVSPSTDTIESLNAQQINPVNLIPAVTSLASNTRPAESVWDSLRREFKLDHREDSSRVQAEIRKILADQGKLYSILKAASPYIYYIHEQVAARGLPAELALIPVIESEFNPNDKSKKGAAGLWQLMPATAHDLGVKVKSTYDGRRNVVDSTKAALAYFHDLGNCFKGDWYLAIAAYNCGEGKVRSVQRRTGSDSYWNLPLPTETKYYVPKLLAVAAIVDDPEKYGVQLPHVTNKPYFVEVKATKTVDLKKVASSSDISIETLHALNPDYYRRSSKTKTQTEKDVHTFLVPVEKAPEVQAKLSGEISYSDT